MPPPAVDDILGRKVFGDLGCKAFWRRYAEEVGSLDSGLREAIRKEPRRLRMSEWWTLPGDYVLTRDGGRKLSLFESAAKTAYQEHLSAWASFARGCWVPEVPNREGTFPTRDKQGWRSKDRELRTVDGELREVGGGFVRVGKVSEFVGDWWSEPLPRLPDAI